MLVTRYHAARVAATLCIHTSCCLDRGCSMAAEGVLPPAQIGRLFGAPTLLQ
jgi:hypothetical protein